MLVLIVGLLDVAWAAQRAKGPRPKDQSLFSAEDETVQRPVAIPEDALQILRNDDQVLQYLKAEGKSPDELTTESFLASEIHLDGPDEKDLIVVGADRLRGANVATFWIFRKSSQSYQLILKAAAHDLRVQKVRSKGYRDIETASPIAGTAHIDVYRFDGKQYRLYRSKSQPIP